MQFKNKALMFALLGSTALAAPVASADELVRIASVPVGAEITGMYVTSAGDFFFNVQHPATAITGPYNKATVGIVTGANFNALPVEVDTAPVPDSAYAKQTVTTSIGSYQILAQQGDFADKIPGGLGAIITVDGEVYKSSNDPDFNGFIPTSAAADEGYLFTNWEDRPGGLSRMRLVKGSDGNWTVDPDDVMMLDFSSVNGTWVNCFGSVSPWSTPLTSEELYFDDSSEWINEASDSFRDPSAITAYLGRPGNPYDYGYIVEITDPAGTPVPVKHMAMSRASHENAVVMPDQRTAYITDDGTDVVFFKFVADAAGDLSSGTLYAAKMTQDAPAGSDVASTAFDIEWIELAHGNNEQVGAWVREYDGLTPADYQEGESGYVSDADVEAWARGEAADDRAAFLESRKAAAALGATDEWRKMEGVMINHDAAASGTVPFMYLAMSEVSKGMSDGEGDVAVAENMCGVVYQMRLDEQFNVSRMVPVVAGSGYDSNNKPNACSTAGVSNPDNVQVLPDGRVLIGEDTGNHENNMLWIWTPPSA